MPLVKEATESLLSLPCAASCGVKRYPGQPLGNYFTVSESKLQALWSALLLFQLLPASFSNRNLRDNLAPLLGQQPADLTQDRMTYELHRLRLHAIIERIPKSHRYRGTDLGLRTAWFFTRTYSRILRTGLGRILPELSKSNGPLRRCFDKLDQEVKSWVEEEKLAA
jgi:hypothetical protein